MTTSSKGRPLQIVSLHIVEVEIEHIYKGHAAAIYTLCEGLTPNLFYTGSMDMFVGCWNFDTGTFEKPLARGSRSVYSLLLDKENQILYVGQRFGSVIIIDLTKKNPPRNIKAHDGDIFDLSRDRLGRIYTAGGDGHIKIWTPIHFELIQDMHISTERLRCVHVSPFLDEFYVGSSDHTARVFDTETLLQKQVLLGHENSVFTVEVLDENRIVTGSRDATFIVWELRDGNWVNVQRTPAHLFTINHLCLSPNKKILASAGRDKTVKLWDTQNLKLLKVLDKEKIKGAHFHSVNKILWRNDQQFISTGDDRQIIAWKITEE